MYPEQQDIENIASGCRSRSEKEVVEFVRY
jgi:hypothetical protein